MARGVLIFAAGFGTRMAPLTNTMPKPMVNVGGRPLLDHAVDIAKPHGPIVLNAHYLGQQIVDYGRQNEIQVSFEPEILDTGGGLKAARHFFKNQCLFTLNSDAIWKGPNPLDVLLENWKPYMNALLLCAPLDQTLAHSGTGDFTFASDKTLSRGPGQTYLGAQIIDASLLESYPDEPFSLNLVWDDLIRAGGLYGCEYPGLWCDVGRPENIVIAEKLLETDSNV